MRMRTKWLIITVLVVVTAYASLFTYAHIGRTVLRYSGPGYVVEYVRYPRLPWPLNILALSPPNTYPLINIAITNAPRPYPHVNARFFIYATGPSVGGFVGIGHYLSHSTSFVINVGNYTGYALELDSYLRMTPDMAGPSIMLFISTITNSSKGPSVVTEFVTVPIILKLARGSVISVIINYTRVARAVLPINATGDAALSFQDPSTQPPSTIPAGCVLINNGHDKGEECWYWQLNTVLLTRDNVPLPLAAQVIRQPEVKYVGQSDISVSITYTKVYFVLSLAIPTDTGVNVEMPGIGYVIRVPGNQIPLDYTCEFLNPSLVRAVPYCEYSGTNNNVVPPNITNAGAYGIALIGYLEIANYTEYECIGPLGAPCTYGIVKLVQWAVMTWFAAYNNTRVNELEAEPLNPTVVMNYVQTLLNNSRAVVTITFPSGALAISLSGVYNQANVSQPVALVDDVGAILKAMGVPLPQPLQQFSNYLITGLTFNTWTLLVIQTTITTENLIGACTHSPIAYGFNYQIYVSKLGSYYPASAPYVDFNVGPCSSNKTS